MDDKVRPRLIQQRGSSVTMLENGVPVMALNDPTDPCLDIAAAVNFLRCGCPKVQLIINIELAHSTWEDCQKTINWSLKCLQLAGEEFTAKLSLPPRPFVITLSRSTS